MLDILMISQQILSLLKISRMFKQRISSCPNGDKSSSQAFTHRWLVAPSFIFQIFRLLTISFYIYIYIYIYIYRIFGIDRAGLFCSNPTRSSVQLRTINNSYVSKFRLQSRPSLTIPSLALWQVRTAKYRSQSFRSHHF